VGRSSSKAKITTPWAKEVGVPFRKVDFSTIPICLVGIASDDELNLGSRKAIGAELALHCGARREVDLLRVRGAAFVCRECGS
jgi:hypothetical protein